ncbi:MAG: peptidase T [Gracilibacter sp. BRH_c7a]|nr:MAG: peptidase T [Gracilibacter sp. BRH_c7a]
MALNVVEEFIKLTTIDSPSKKEGALAKYLKQRLNELNAQVIEDDSALITGSDTGNLIAFYPGNMVTAPTIMLAAHMDSIASTEGLIPQIRDGIIYSDGEHVLAADDKAGIAVILALLSMLSEDKSITHNPIEIVLTVQEEVGLIGVKNLNYKLKSEYGYVLDGDGPVGTVINAAPSQIGLDLIVEGKAAHAGLEPENGINAIVVASKAISSLPIGRIDEETTSNIGVISGGTRTNVVPDKVEIKAEVRSRSMEKLENQTKKLIAKFEEVSKEQRSKFSYTKELAYESFAIDSSHIVVRSALEAGKKLGIDVTLKGTGGGLDANVFNSRGISCVALGLGNEKPHSKDECISIDELEKSVHFLLAIFKNARM